MKNGVPGINPLDEACKTHDIAYWRNSDLETRHKADQELAEKAWNRFKAADASLGEKSFALLTSGIIRGKRAIGAGVCKKRRRVTKRKTKKGKGVKKTIRRKTTGTKSKSRKVKGVRVIKLPRKGGFLSYLVPLLSGLSNIGSVAGTAKDLLQTIQKMKGGKGMRTGAVLAPFKSGYGLYIRPWEPKYEDRKY